MMKRQSCHFCGFSGANGAARRSPNTTRAVYLFDDDLFPKFYFNVKSQKYREKEHLWCIWNQKKLKKPKKIAWRCRSNILVVVQ